MTVDVMQQARAMCQGLLLGGGLGVLYDLLRVVRVRGKLRWLGGAADLIFWLAAVWALFRWSLPAWGGQVRLYGAGSISACSAPGCCGWAIAWPISSGRFWGFSPGR